LPTPGGPMNMMLVASSVERPVARSRINASSTDGWAEKSKSSSRHGVGKYREPHPTRRLASVAVNLDGIAAVRGTRAVEFLGHGWSSAAVLGPNPMQNLSAWLLSWGHGACPAVSFALSAALRCGLSPTFCSHST